MSNEIFPSDRIYKFLKVEEYFPRYQEWEKLGSVESHSFNKEKKTLFLKFKRNDGKECLTQILHLPKN